MKKYIVITLTIISILFYSCAGDEGQSTNDLSEYILVSITGIIHSLSVSGISKLNTCFAILKIFDCYIKKKGGVL